MNFKNLQSKTFISILASIMLIAALVGYITIGDNATLNQPITYSLPQPLTATIQPNSPVQLRQDQIQVFTANVSKQDAALSYYWLIENPSSDNPTVNGTNYLLLTCDNQAIFKFLTGNIDFYWLTIEVNSTNLFARATVTIQQVSTPSVKTSDQQSKNSQANQQTQTQDQNYYTTNVYNNLASTASYIVKTDGKGQYTVINGTDGNTITDYTSDSADTTLNKAIAQGGIIAIRSGNYSGAELNVPANVNIIAEPEVTGIKYASIADGAKINEPTFNDAFGSYIGGSYTVVTNSTTTSTSKTSYLAFKPDNSIYCMTTDPATVLNRALEAGSTIIINEGTYPINSDLIINKSYTKVVGNGQVIIQALSGVHSMFKVYGQTSETPTMFAGISNLILDGNNSAFHGIWLNNTWGTKIEGIRGFEMCYCIWLDYNSQDTLVSNSNMHDSWVGIIINGTRNQGFLSQDNWIARNTIAGFKITNNNENTKVTLERTFFTYSNPYGIYCPSEDGQMLIDFTIRDSWVEDSYINGNSGVDIYIKNAQSPIIEGNFLFRAATKGDSHIILNNVFNGRISNNYICNTNYTYPLVTCTGISQFNTFQSNTLLGSSIGYYFVDYATKNTIYYSQTNCKIFIYAPVSLSSNFLSGTP